MSNRDKDPLPVEHDLTETADANTASKFKALATRKRRHPAADRPTKPHKNTGSLDSLGGGRLP
ncbi:hypothetical protein ACXR0M_25270 [Pseudomonas sp. Eth.TT006]